ncbi:MAG: AAA family ATPase [Candidatus Methylumidiphilus sp.]
MLHESLHLDSGGFFSSLAQRGGEALDLLMAHTHTKAAEKSLPLLGISEAARLVGISTVYLRKLETAGELPAPAKDEAGRRAYSMAQVNAIRAALGRLPKNQSGKAIVVAFANLKGGSAKTTTAAHFAQYAARQGYRVLLADMDPQASMTGLFGYNPQLHIAAEETLGPALVGEPGAIRQSIRPTYWHRLDLAPSNLNLVGAEMALLGMGDNATRLRAAVDGVAGEYDMIVLDAPPALGLLSINVLCASDYIVTPIIPTMVDISSSIQFFHILESLPTLRLSRLSILITRFNGGVEHVRAASMLRSIYGDTILTNQMIESAELLKSGNDMVSVYEIAEIRGSRETYRRALGAFDAVNQEILIHAKSLWDSDTVAVARAAKAEAA